MAMETIVPGDRVPESRPPRNEALWASLGPFILALCYARALVWPEGPSAISDRSLTKLFQIQFLVIHSFPFLAILANLRGPGGTRPLFLKILFWLVLALYVIVSFSTFGWEGLLIFAVATLATYLGFWFHRFDAMALASLAGRWFLGFVIYLGCITVFHLPSSVEHWSPGRDLFLSGFWYFLIIGVLELMGLYSMPFWEKVKKFLASAESSGRHHD